MCMCMCMCNVYGIYVCMYILYIYLIIFKTNKLTIASFVCLCFNFIHFILNKINKNNSI